MSNDVSRGKLLRSAPAREAGTHSVCHEMHDAGVAATLGHDEGDSAPSARALQHASFEIMTKKQMTMLGVLVDLSCAQGEGGSAPRRKIASTHAMMTRTRRESCADTSGDIDSRAIDILVA